MVQQLAVGLETTYDTTVAVTQLVPFLSENLDVYNDLVENDSMTGPFGRAAPDLGESIGEGGFTSFFNRQSRNILLQHLMGIETEVTMDAEYNYDIADEIAGTSFPGLTVAVRDDVTAGSPATNGCKFNAS